MLAIFLCHHHLDKPFARRLADRLKAHGIRVWLDEAEMGVGDSLLSKIESAIRECTYLAVVLSPRSVSSLWVQREVNMALSEEIHGRRVKVLPLLQEKCSIPGFLMDKVYADFTVDFNSGFSALIQRLESDLHEESYKQKRAYEILQSGYQDWIAFSKQDNHLLDRPTVDLVVQYVPESSLSMNLLEFLLASISLVWDSVEANSHGLGRLRTWIGADSSRLLDALLEHPNQQVRIGSLTLFGWLGNQSVAERLFRLAREEHQRDVRRAALRTASHLGVALPDGLSRDLLDSDADWVVQSYAIRGSHDKLACLLVSDGTQFAIEIGRLAKDAGFRVATLPAFLESLESVDFGHRQDDLLRAYSLVIVVRGEHFTQYGNEKFYSQIGRFVAEGGTLFATSWVSWETKYHYEFAQTLPFDHIRDTYNENVSVICRATDEGIARQLLAESVSYRTSMELLERKEGATVLLEEGSSVPILGYRAFGSGICYYFNTCQHSCLGKMESPLKASVELAAALGKLLVMIHAQMDVHRRTA
jgi:hypothetical protein